MLLRTSGEADGTAVDLHSVMRGERDSGGDIPHTVALLQFAEAAVKGTGDELAAARQRVLTELGLSELVDAAAVIGNFEKNVRIADSTGIPLDDFLEARSADFRNEVGINAFAR
jgi:hypothetical protein